MSSIFSLKLRDASYKGIPFYVSDVKKKIQRKTVLHEYPQKDKAFLEDLGKAATRYEVTAFLVGDNCVEQAKKLESVLLEPGPGTFVNPWYGELNVSVIDASSIDFDNLVHRYCSLSISFVEAVDLQFPASVKDSTTWARQISEKIGLDAVSDFVEKCKDSKYYKLYESAVNGTLLDQLGIISNSELATVFSISDECLELAANGAYLLGAGPTNFAGRLLSVLGLARFSSTQTRWSGVVDQLVNISQNSAFSYATKAAISRSNIVSDMEAEKVSTLAAVDGLMRAELLSEAVGASTMIEVEEGDEKVSIDEMIAVRDGLMAAIDNELTNPLLSDELFIDLLEARCAVFSNLTEKAEGLSRLISISLPENIPALAVAYDYYDDALRESEIVARNKIVHGAFCPTDIRILSK